jgi:CubicO group peptidase (beta-lactamase class C family)
MGRLPLLFLIFAATFLVSAPALAQGNGGPSFEQKASRLDALFRSASSSGGAYLMRYRRGRQIITRGYGSLACAGSEPMPTDALFDSGSLTKWFTAAAIYQLVEQRRLKLDDRLGDIFRGIPSDKRLITVAQLLSHRAGIANLVGPRGRVVSQREWTPETYDYAPVTKAQLLTRVWEAPLQFPPGTDEAYSNTGYSILAAIVEEASAGSYEPFVRQHILLPLGMTTTGYQPSPDRHPPIVQQCRSGGAAWGDPFTRGLYRSGVSWNIMGNGGMMTTLDDLDRWSAGLETAKLFRPDIQARFDASLFGPSYRCRTESTAVGGSNGMTRSLILHMPRRQEVLISVATRADHPLPQEKDMLAILCGE